MDARSALLCSALVLAATLACNRPAEEAGPPAAVVNEALDLSLSAVPAPFDGVVNEGETLELTTADGSGRVAFRVGPSGQYPNLKEVAEQYGKAFEERPSGEYHGSLELGTHWGPAYYSRGSWQGEGARREETRIFALHPEAADRLLEVSYLYPAGEGQERVQQLFAVVAEVVVPEVVVPEPGPAAEE